MQPCIGGFNRTSLEQQRKPDVIGQLRSILRHRNSPHWIRQRTSVCEMEYRLTSPTGRTYHLLPHERMISERFASGVERVATKKGRPLRSGPTAVALRGAGVGNALIGVLLSIAFLVSFGSQAHRLVSSTTPTWEIKVWVCSFIVALLPFWFLQLRRRIQASSEYRSYRRSDISEVNPNVD